MRPVWEGAADVLDTSATPTTTRQRGVKNDSTNECGYRTVFRYRGSGFFFAAQEEKIGGRLCMSHALVEESRSFSLSLQALFIGRAAVGLSQQRLNEAMKKSLRRR